ncbi:MAG: hypothetical protein AB1393_02505 [Candidatus Edwardsbacteria bacterium]
MDILKELLVSAHPSGKKAVGLIFYFDSGSPYTFIHKSAGLRLGNLIPLPEPEIFSGLGGGGFKSSEILLIHIKLLDFWCRQIAYVVDQNILEPTYDILAGHDFMQLYGIRLHPEKEEIEIDQKRVSLSQKVRRSP